MYYHHISMSLSMSKYSFENIAISIIWLYSDFSICCYNYACDIYNKNDVVRNVVDWCFSTASFLSKQYTILTSSKRNEPEADHWFCVCTLPEIDYYSEIYEIIQGSEVGASTDEQKYSFAFSMSDLSNIDTITILKKDGKYKVQLFDTKRISMGISDEDTISSFELLSATYSHPKMKTSVELKLPQSMFVVGNQLFSPVFVKRCLKYQDASYLFDLDYTVTLIDKDIQVMTIRSSEYLLVESTGVSIKGT